MDVIDISDNLAQYAKVQTQANITVMTLVTWNLTNSIFKYLTNIKVGTNIII